MDAIDAYRSNRVLALREWQARYDAMVIQALCGSASARRQAAALFEILHDRRFAFRRSLDCLTTADPSRWEDARAGVEESWEALLSATEEVATQLDRAAATRLQPQT